MTLIRGLFRSAALGRRRILFVGVGTTGAKACLQFKAWLERLFGGVPPSVKIIAYDIDPRQEEIHVDNGNGEDVTVRLEPGIDSEILGKGLDFGKLAAEVKRNPELHREVAELLALQPDGRLPANLSWGAQGEPIAGVASWLWSLNRIRASMLRAIEGLLDARIAGESPGKPALTCFIVGSLPGGTGSHLLLPAIAEVRNAMDEAGADPDASLIVEIAVLPEAFDDSPQRLAVAWSALRYHAMAFSTGRLPFEDGASAGTIVDLPLVVGPVSEAGHRLRDLDQLTSTIALACAVIGAYPMKETAAALLTNMSRTREAVLPNGEPRFLGSFGMFVLYFPPEQVADYLDERTVELFVDAILKPPDGPVEATVDRAFIRHFADAEALLAQLTTDDDGEPLLEDLVQAASVELRRGKLSRGRVLQRLQKLEASYETAATEAVLQARRSGTQISEALLTTLTTMFTDGLNSGGPVNAVKIIGATLERLSGEMAKIEREREKVKGTLANEKEAAKEVLLLLENSEPRGLLGVGGGGQFKRALQEYLRAAADALHAGFALEAAEIAGRSLAGVFEACAAEEQQVRRLAGHLAAVKQRCRDDQQAFEAGTDTLAVEKKIYTPSQLRDLFAERVGGDWNQLGEHALQQVAAAAGTCSSWLGLPDAQSLRTRLLTAAATCTGHVRDMNIEDYVRWLIGRGELDASTCLRDWLDQASPLCRFERTRLPAEDDLSDTSLAFAGVPDAETSIVRDAAGILPVGTADKERMVFIRVLMGLAPSTLWRAPKYKEAYDKVRAQGRVALNVYPNFDTADGNAGKPQRRLKGRA
jgi:hypothetical protein